MYRYIKGTVEEIGEDYIVIDNNGIGYLINTSRSSIMNIGSEGEELKIFTYLNVREDDLSLYGFVTRKELDIFKLLLLVSGIGPKVALAMLSTLNSKDIQRAIVGDDIDVLCKAPGIGKKTAKRIVLELKEKVEKTMVSDGFDDLMQPIVRNDIDEVIEALNSLGYTNAEIKNVLSDIDKKGLKTEDIIKLALKKLF